MTLVQGSSLTLQAVSSLITLDLSKGVMDWQKADSSISTEKQNAQSVGHGFAVRLKSAHSSM